MGIYTGFGLESLIQLLLEGEVLWMYGLILLVLLAISRFGILWTTNSTAGMMLGSDIRNQGDADVDCGNYSSDPNGLSFYNPNTIDPMYHVELNSAQVFNLDFSLSNYTIYQILNHPNFGFSTLFSNSPNKCSNVPGYRRSSVILNGENNTSESDLRNTLTIYPNPFETEFRIESSSVSIKEIALFDVLGKSMLTEVGLLEKTHLINLNTAPGCYLLKVVLENGEVTYHKIVKSND